MSVLLFYFSIFFLMEINLWILRWVWFWNTWKTCRNRVMHTRVRSEMYEVFIRNWEMLTRGCHKSCFVPTSNLMLCVVVYERFHLVYDTSVCILFVSKWTLHCGMNKYDKSLEKYCFGKPLLNIYFFISSTLLLCFRYLQHFNRNKVVVYNNIL